MVNIAQTNKHFHNLAMDIYRRKYQEKMITLEGRAALYNEVYCHEKSISFSNPSIATKFLHMFGHLITKVMIFDVEINAEIIKNIARNINKYCWNSLVHFESYNVQMEIWGEFTEPFSKLENITFKNILKTPENINLTEIFPSLRRLSLENVHSFNERTFDVNFPHLEQLMVGFLDRDFPNNPFAKGKFELLCQKNPQIRDLRLNFASKEAIKAAADNFKNLEMLELTWPKWNNQHEVHFERVKKFILNYAKYLPPLTIFPQIQEIEILCHPTLDNKCIDFVGTNEGLKRLHIKNQAFDAHISKFTEILPNLVDLSLVCGFGVRSENIVNLITQHNDMKSLRLIYAEKSLGDNLKTELSKLKHEYAWKYIGLGQNGEKDQLELLRIDRKFLKSGKL